MFKSTSNPKCFSKSGPIIGFLTSAITNGQQYGRRKPRFKVIIFVPYVLIALPFAAYNLNVSDFCCLSVLDGGTTEMSAPLSTRYLSLLVISVTNKRFVITAQPVAASKGLLFSFSYCGLSAFCTMSLCIF